MQATAIAMITCESTDEDAYHCASVTASATAFAEATAEAHASAVSKAVSSCGCMTDAVSVAVASSEIYIKLIAEATATATASVCIEGAHACADRAVHLNCESRMQSGEQQTTLLHAELMFHRHAVCQCPRKNCSIGMVV